MTPMDLRPLKQVAEALYHAEERKVRAILEEEARLRRAIARIDASLAPPVVAEPAAEPSQPAAVQLCGADMVWRLQMRRQKSALNTELARVLAVKSGELARMRKAFGRREALRLTLARNGDCVPGSGYTGR